MGLDAVVYRKLAHLRLGHDEERAKVILKTGEVYFDDDKLARKYDQQREAVAHRLGNIALISLISKEVSQLIGPESFFERKVLYSGTHSGDVIPLSDLAELSAELEFIRKTGKGSPYLLDFLSAFEGLIQAAKDECNPIVFV